METPRDRAGGNWKEKIFLACLVGISVELTQKKQGNCSVSLPYSFLPKFPEHSPRYFGKTPTRLPGQNRKKSSVVSLCHIISMKRLLTWRWIPHRKILKLDEQRLQGQT